MCDSLDVQACGHVPFACSCLFSHVWTCTHYRHVLCVSFTSFGQFSKLRNFLRNLPLEVFGNHLKRNNFFLLVVAFVFAASVLPLLLRKGKRRVLRTPAPRFGAPSSEVFNGLTRFDFPSQFNSKKRHLLNEK